MTDQQHPDDADITQRHEVPAEPPAWPATAGHPRRRRRPRPAIPALPRWSATPRRPSRGPTGRDTRAAPEPATTPERWYEPAVVPGTVPTTPVQPATSGSGRSGRGGLGHPPGRVASCPPCWPRAGRSWPCARPACWIDRHWSRPARPVPRSVPPIGRSRRRELGDHRCRRRGQPGRRPDHDRAATSIPRPASSPRPASGRA